MNARVSIMAKLNTYRDAFRNALRRLIDGGSGYGLALKGIIATEVARSITQG